MSNYEWHYFYNFFVNIGHWYIAYIAMDWIVCKHMSGVSLYCSIYERIFGHLDNLLKATP